MSEVNLSENAAKVLEMIEGMSILEAAPKATIDKELDRRAVHGRNDGFGHADQLGEGRMKIDWAESRMPVMMALRREHAEKQSLKGMRITGCLHVTKETAVLVETLAAAAREHGVILECLAQH